MRKGDHLSNQLVIILMLDIIFELDSTQKTYNMVGDGTRYFRYTLSGHADKRSLCKFIFSTAVKCDHKLFLRHPVPCTGYVVDGPDLSASEV